jgi:hypothetical protein
MTYAQQLKMGRKVEKEHIPYYRQIKSSGKCPTESKFTEGIAKSHISEDSAYYTKLKKAGL